MKKYYLALFAVILMMLNLSGLSASAAELQLFDPGYRLSSSEFNDAAERLQQTVNTIDMNIVVILGNEERSDTTIESMTRSTYEQLYGNRADGVCYYLDLSSSAHPYDYMVTAGLAQFYYTNSDNNNRINQMYSAIDKYLYPKGSEDAVGALNEFADQLEIYYQSGIPDKYWFYDHTDRVYYHVENGEMIATSGKPYADTGKILIGGILGLVIGIIAAGVTNASVKSKYKFMYQISPTTYLNKKSVRYTEQSDRFIRERVSKTHVSDTGGRSGGHHSGGGGGHSSGGFGGGGHHR